MKYLGFPLTVLVLAAGLAGQPLQILVPTTPPPPDPISISYPVAGPPMRYQQWIAAAELATPGVPVRITALELIGGSPGGQTGTIVDLEVTMGNGPLQPSAVMNQNLINAFSPQPLPPVVVYPRRVAPQPLPTLGTAVPGASVMQLPFTQPFVWDGISAVVVEIKVFSNGLGGRPFPYDLSFTTQALGRSWRLFGVGPDPDVVALASFTQPNAGIRILLTYEFGATVPYGAGCPGAGGIVPVAFTTGGLPLPGNRNWAQVVDKANSGVNALLLLGLDQTMWAGVPLPLDLAFLGAPTCSVLTDVRFYLGAVTVGGGPGGGMATIRTPIPPVTVFTGLSLFTQWFVADPQSPNGVLAVSHGLWNVFG